MWLALLVSTLGYAQSPQTFGPRGESRWLTEDVQAERFFAYEGEAEGISLRKGDEVEMVVASGDRIRVKRGSRYGWVSAAVLTAEAPTFDASKQLLVPTSP